MPISFKKGLAIADEHEPKVIAAIEALGFKCIDHTTSTENAKPTGLRKYRDERGLIKPDATFVDLKTGKKLYVDIKTKEGPVYYFMQKSWRHGNEAIENYRKRSALDNTPFIVVFEEPEIRGFTYTRNGTSSPPIDIGGLWIVNVNTPYIGQDYARKDLKYTGLCYYDRKVLIPVERIREVAGL
jgi:hypothetical protein